MSSTASVLNNPYQPFYSHVSIVKVDSADSQPSHSPLSKGIKRPFTATDLGNRTQPKRKLFKSAVGPKDLKQFYGIDFDHPAMANNKIHFFQLRDQLLLIENACVEGFDGVEILRKIINKILHSSTLSHEKKMAEFGAIYFFVERNGRFKFKEDISSFTDLRSQEMAQKIHIIKQAHAGINDKLKKRVPSGKTQYILRALARMIISNTQKLNIGGLYALIEILNRPALGIVYHLVPEHRTHILCVLTNILKKPHFKTLLEKTIEVHSDMEESVRLVLKLPKKCTITSLHAARACVMALLFDVRQNEQENCFSVSALVYMTQYGTYKVLSQMIDVLNTGHLAFSDSITIPLFSLLEKRLLYEKELSIQCLPSTTSVLNSTLFGQLSKALGCDTNNTPSIDKTHSLHFILQEFLKVNHVEEHAIFAKKLLYAFKTNSLTEMMLTILEWQSANNGQTDCSGQYYSSSKETLIDFLVAPLKKTYKNQFCHPFGEKIGKLLWFEDCTETELTRTNGKITVGPSHRERVYIDDNHNLKLLQPVLLDSRRIFVMQHGQYLLIETISELQTLLQQIAEEVAIELKFGKIKIANIKKLISKKDYAQIIAHFCSEQIKKGSHKNRDYTDLLLSHDLLLCMQEGGWPEKVLKCQFKLNLKTYYWKNGSALQCLQKLYKIWKKIDRTLLNSCPTLLVSSAEHSFTLTVQRCDLMYGQFSSFSDFIEQGITQKASNFLKQSIPQEVINAVLMNYDGETKKIIQANLEKMSKLSYFTFRQLLQTHFVKATPADLNAVIDSEYSKISVSSEQIFATLNRANVHVEPEIPLLIYECFKKKFGINRIYPSQFATFMRKELIRLGCVVIDPSILEKAICEELQLPYISDFFDLNWGSKKENPHHVRLIMRYHFGLNEICYFKRQKDIEILESSKSYKYFRLFYPHL